MSAICGWVGPGGGEDWVDRMLAAVAYRGDRSDTAQGPGFGLGMRGFLGRPSKAQSLFRAADGALCACAGSLSPPAPDPAAALDLLLRQGDLAGLDDLDGAFAAARWDGALTLLRDPFGVRSLYYAEHQGTFVFATEVKQLLALPGFEARVDLPAVHKYLTFGFVPGEDAIIAGVRRLLPGRRLRLDPVTRRPVVDVWFSLTESVDPRYADENDVTEAVRAVRRAMRVAVARRLNGEPTAGLALSGGLDSSAVGFFLRREGAEVHALSLDFGEGSVDRQAAIEAAAALGVRHQWVAADGNRVDAILDDLVDRLDLPFGDAVTGPQYLLAQAAREAGLSALWNGEGGDQLFGGWTSKPMVAAAVFGDVDDSSPEEEYLRSYHRFYGLESALYAPALAEATGGPGQRRALLAPYLGEGAAQYFLNRLRLADLSLKGSQNILPRAERVGNGVGIDVRVPLFDRALAELSFHLPPSLKLRGASEKHVLKLALKGRLPESVVWRRKSGMSVPVTDWLLGPKGAASGPLTARLRDTLGRDALLRRGWFQPDYVERLLSGQDSAGEVRRRRVGEKLWTLLMLEMWARRFLDRR